MFVSEVVNDSADVFLVFYLYRLFLSTGADIEFEL